MDLFGAIASRYSYRGNFSDLPVPRADFNDARAGVQIEPIRVPMHQPLLAVGEKPRLADRRVVAVVLPIVSVSIPGLLPSLRPQSAPVSARIPQVFSWCFRACGVVVPFFREEPNPLIPPISRKLSRCTSKKLRRRNKIYRAPDSGLMSGAAAEGWLSG